MSVKIKKSQIHLFLHVCFYSICRQNCFVLWGLVSAAQSGLKTGACQSLNNTVYIQLHSSQHLEIRNQDTFISALAPPPPQKKKAHLMQAHWMLKTWGRGRLKQIDCVLHSAPKIHKSFIYMVQIDKDDSSQFAEKLPGKYWFMS